MLKSVADTYKGKSVFITGCTGFLGKALVEKLLYSCSGLDKVYVLVRESKNSTAQVRMQKILEQTIFSRLRHKRLDVLKKIIPVTGDITKSNLGIDYKDEQALIDNVSFVFHAAAMVRLNEPLPVSVDVNLTGTKRVLQLSQRMKNIEKFVHVSTAYANLDKPITEEIVYSPSISFAELMKILDNGPTKKQTKDLLDASKRPNTYTFTKALAETLVKEYHENVPSVIIRPSLVSASYSEPFEGWVDNGLGATEIMTMISRGLNRVLLSKPTNILDLIPIDYVTNLIIVAATCESSKDVAVYNCTTSGDNPLTTKQFLDLAIQDSIKRKSYDIVKPSIMFSESESIVSLSTLLLQKFPSYVADMYLIATKQEKRFLKMQDRVLLVRNSIEHFTKNSWIFHAKKTRELARSLSPSDRRQFPFDPTYIKWSEYIRIYHRGAIHFFNEKH